MTEARLQLAAAVVLGVSAIGYVDPDLWLVLQGSCLIAGLAWLLVSRMEG